MENKRKEEIKQKVDAIGGLFRGNKTLRRRTCKNI